MNLPELIEAVFNLAVFLFALAGFLACGFGLIFGIVALIIWLCGKDPNDVL